MTCPPSSLFTFRLTKEQFEEIHQHIMDFSGTLDESVRLSRLDVLVGVIAQAHTTCNPENPPITGVMHMINVSIPVVLPVLQRRLPYLSNEGWASCIRIPRATAL